MRKLLMAGTMLCALAIPAKAVTVNVGDVGASGTTSLQGFVDVGATTQSISGLTGSLFLKYDGANAAHTVWTFDYTVTNTSSGNVTASSIGSFGLATTPNISSALSTGLYDLALINPSFPNVGGHGSGIEACFSAGNNSCNGNGTTLTEGQQASGTFTLTFASGISSLSLDAAFLRFQGIDATSPYLHDDSGVGNNTDVHITPLAAVPGPIAGAGIPGLIAACGMLIGLAKRRRQQRLA